MDENGLFLPAKEWEELFNDIRSDVKNSEYFCSAHAIWVLSSPYRTTSD